MLKQQIMSADGSFTMFRYLMTTTKKQQKTWQTVVETSYKLEFCSEFKTLTIAVQVSMDSAPD